jgi:hypothetical protein
MISMNEGECMYNGEWYMYVAEEVSEAKDVR